MNNIQELLPAEAFSHIRIMVGTVAGLCITRLLTGVARFAQHPRKKELYWVHLMWIAFTLLTVFHFWWFEFLLRSSRSLGFGVYIFILFYASLHFLLSALLVPDNIDEHGDYRNYFLVNKRYFFGTLIAFNITDLIDTLLKGADHFLGLGAEYPAQIAAFVILCFFAASTRNLRFHAAFATCALIYQASFIFRKFDILS